MNKNQVSNRKPGLLETDGWKEYKKKIVTEFLTGKDKKRFIRYRIKLAVFAERFIRTTHDLIEGPVSTKQCNLG